MFKQTRVIWVMLGAMILLTSQNFVVEAQKSSKNVWSDPVVQVKTKTPPPPPPTKKGPRKPPPPKIQLKPLLTLEFKILKRGEDGKAQEVNPYSTFYTGDLIQIKVKPNQDGYLYILNNNEGQDQ